VAYVQPRGTAQPHVLAGHGQDLGVDLAYLLSPTGVLGGQGARQRAGATADVQHAAGPGGAQDDADPAEVVELQVQRIGQVDVGRIHLALAQQPA